MSDGMTGGRTLAVSASSPERNRPGPRDVALALLAGGIAFLAYLLTMAPSVESNDAGRFQIASPLLGTGHPTGYPTFILLGKLFTYLPFGDVAYRVNLMAGLFGGLAVALAFLVMRRLGAGASASLGCVLLFAFTATFWSQATVAEVYTMHITFLLAVVLLLLRWRDEGDAVSLVVAGLVCGAALGNNAGVVLFAPAFLGLMFVGRIKSLTARSVISCSVAFLVGLSVYAYVPIRGFSGAWSNYGDEADTWTGVWDLVSGSRFQGLMDPSPAQLLSGTGEFLGTLATQTSQPFGYALAGVLVFGTVLGAASLLLRDAVVGASLLIGGAAALFYALSYRIEDIEAYYLPVFMVMTLLLAVGVGGVSGTRGRGWLVAAPTVLAALVFGLNLAGADRSGDYAPGEEARATLAGLPDGAVLYGKTDLIPITYLNRVEGVRPDVALRWLDGGTLENSFPNDIESGRPVYFISDPAYNEDYLPAVEELATRSREGGLILLTPR